MDTRPEKAADDEKVTLKQWFSVAFVYLLVALILLGISRDLGWWQAWVFSVALLIVGVGGRFLAERNHPGLMNERLHLGHEGVKGWDKLLAPLMGFAVLFPHVIVAGLDNYYGWTTPFALWLQAIALVLILFGYAFADWALVVNRYFSLMVRIQKDRGHVVCDTGPYRYVRHPAYAGNVVASFTIPFFLDSWWVMGPAVIALVITVVRTALEDRTLINELQGYRDYASRVRYKLIPFIW